MECPKCKTSYYRSVKTKYLPLITVPSYAELQPAERLSLCRVCGFYGKHKLEMLEKHTVGNMQFWSNKEIEAMKENRR